MDNLYFGKSKINTKKVIICLIILILLLGICLFTAFVFYKNRPTDYNIDKTFLIDNKFNITFSQNYNLEEYKSSDSFLLELHSNSNLNVYISKLDGIENKSLYMIAKADSNSFTKEFDNIAELSDITQHNINEIESYTYNFEYLDSSNIPYYIQIFFIKLDNSIYSIDIEFPVSNMELMLPAIDNILSTITLK
ncbi:MAG: hypothetical protein ACI4UE_00035 [Candidatus Scatovivens sp.]